MSASNSVVIPAPPGRVFEVLSDPLTYPEWLVGAQTIRSVDREWPRQGARFHHRIGVGPLTMPGSTSVRRWVTPIVLELAAGMGPFGEANVVFTLEPVAEGTLLTVEEEPSRGLARVAWRGARPLVATALWGRNAVSLSSLADLVDARC
jgi:uncharacterized protein YndB with AHSA1/START domain